MFNISLKWCHNEHNGVWHHQPHDCLLNRLFRRRSKKISKLRVTGLCHRWPVNSPQKGPVTRKIIPFDDVIMVIMQGTNIYIYIYIYSLYSLNDAVQFHNMNKKICNCNHDRAGWNSHKSPTRITRDAKSVSSAEICKFSKSQRDVIDAVEIMKRIVFDIICYVAYHSAAKFKPFI